MSGKFCLIELNSLDSAIINSEVCNFSKINLSTFFNSNDFIYSLNNNEFFILKCSRLPSIKTNLLSVLIDYV